MIERVINMPIYEYRCKDCGNVSEFLEGVGRGEAEKVCKHCGSQELTKIFSTSYVSSSSHFIGSQGGKTCCGRDERCDIPPCSDEGVCKR